VAAAVWVIHRGASGPHHALALATLLAGYLGGTAPDWLEQVPFRKNRRWCPHRSVTHWVPAWGFGVYWSFSHLGQEWWWAPLLGFLGAGLLHLACDWPNPLGVPIIWSRHSLHLWKSGKADSVVVTLCWLAALWFSDSLLFGSVHFRRAFSLLAMAAES
jgi:hypothetical protein